MICVAGVEDLTGLRELDLANNCLSDHNKLRSVTPLSRLNMVILTNTTLVKKIQPDSCIPMHLIIFKRQHHARFVAGLFQTQTKLVVIYYLMCFQLMLEGNPLSFHSKHRPLTMKHIHPIAASRVSIIIIIIILIKFYYPQ